MLIRASGSFTTKGTQARGGGGGGGGGEGGQARLRMGPMPFWRWFWSLWLHVNAQACHIANDVQRSFYLVDLGLTSRPKDCMGRNALLQQSLTG